MANLLLVTPTQEIKVATFKSVSEAFRCGSLLQCSTEDDRMIYYVEFKEKGVNRRSMCEDFLKTIQFLNSATKSNLTNYLTSRQFLSK